MKTNKLRQLIRDVLKEEIDPREVNIFGYETKHFDVCPGAQGLYKRIVAGEFTDGMPGPEEQDLITRSAKLHDALFALEKNVLNTGGNELDIETAQIIADQIMAMAKMMDLEEEHNYVQNHVKIISDTVNKKN
jgi:hypothetical protein